MELHPGPHRHRLTHANLAALEPIRRALEDNDDWFQDVVEHSQDLLCTHDLAGRILSVNAAPARVLGYSVEELLRLSLREIIVPKFQSELDSYLNEVKASGESSGLMAAATRSGEQRVWQYYSTLRKTEAASPIVRVIAHDVTDQRRTEKLLREASEDLLRRVRERERTIDELELFRALLDQSNDAIEVVDPETLRFLDVNEKACAALGYKREELLALRVVDIDPMATEASTAKVVEQLQSGPFLMESVHRRKDGSSFPVEVSMRWVQLDRDYVVAIVRDLSERKHADARLLASENRYRALHNNSPAGICWVETGTGRFLGVNPKFCEIAGRTEQDLLERDFQSITHPQDLAESCNRVEELAAGKVRQYRFEKRYLRPDGSTRWVEISVVAIPWDDTPVWHMAIVLDITERKHTEEALKESEARFRTLYERSPAGICWLNTKTGQFTGVNPKYCEITGRTEQDLLGRNFQSITHPDDLSRNLEELRQLREGRIRGFEMEKRYVRPDGSIRWVKVAVMPMWAEGEDATWNFAMVEDITDRTQTVEALKKSEEKFSKAFRQSPMVLTLSSTRTHHYIDVNETFERLTGWRREEVIGRTALDIGLWAPGEVDLAALLLAEGCVRNVESRFRMRDGSIRIGSSTAEAIEVNGEPCMLAVTADITERKQAEESLRRNEENYRLFVSQSSEGIFRQDLDAPIPVDLPEDELVHRILYDHYMAECNDAMAAMYGFASGKELVGMRLTEMVVPDDPRNIELTREFIRSGFRVIDRESHEVDVHGNPKIFLNSMIGTVENGMLLRTWGIQRDITEKVKLEEARKRAEEAIAALVQVRADSSENFFYSMAIELAKCLEADYTIIGELIEGEEGKVRTIGVCGQGVIAENFTRELAGTPCGQVIERGTSSYAAGVTEIFPTDFLLKQMKIEGYAGTPLRDSRGQTIGLMVALYAKPLATSQFAEMILQLFSTRTAAEIERKRTEEALRQSEQRFRIALSGAPIKVFNQDRDLRYTWAYNLPVEWPEKDIIGRTDEEIFGAENAARMLAIKKPVMETGRGIRQEFTLTARGKTYHCDITVEPLFDAAGNVIGVNSACVDISQLREIMEELRLAKEKLSEEKLYLEEAIDTELGFGEIVGRSSALKEVMQKVAKVAPSDATVLLLGETGTGKELVARAVHRLSKRQGNSFIKMNCAAIPSGLLESELFGHEKGAFTGAIARKLGRLELADKGTLFLDEIGEIPLSLQPKLLRVLQDMEFERLGSTQTLKVNFRLLAATNRDLLQSVKIREFRSDLYYRLNVFPIVIPPLRERREDIRPLVEHFVRKFALQMKRSITSIPTKTMEMLVRWDWPGNIRELENFVERSVILSPGSVLLSPLSELQKAVEEGHGKTVTLRDKERDRILQVLKNCNGKLGGPDGAAARLGLKRTTLQSKLDQLGIKPGNYRT